MRANNPHPNGKTGLNPGTETTSSCEAGIVASCGGMVISATTASRRNRPTIPMEAQHIQRHASPYHRQNRRGEAMRSRRRWPIEVRTMRTNPSIRRAFQRSRRPDASQPRTRRYHTTRKARIAVRSNGTFSAPTPSATNLVHSASI